MTDGNGTKINVRTFIAAVGISFTLVGGGIGAGKYLEQGDTATKDIDTIKAELNKVRSRVRALECYVDSPQCGAISR